MSTPTLSCTGGDTQEKCDVIDREIQTLEEAIRALKSRRNVLAPTSRLPSEILSIIFHLCVDANYSLCWIRFSHVSQLWRSVAIDTPSLWTNIPFSFPKLAKEMLLRSKMAPLVLRLTPGSHTPKEVDFVKFVLQNHFSRAGEIHVQAYNSDIVKLLSSLPVKLAPLLHTLTFVAQINSSPYSPGNISVPEGFLGSNTPNLKRLELEYCDIDWTAITLSGLTHFKYHSSLSGRPTTFQLLQALGNMPTLQELDLQGVLNGDDLPPDFGVVRLPRLSYLAVGSSVMECVKFLQKATFPDTVRLDLSCTETEGGTQALSDLYKQFLKFKCNPCHTFEATSNHHTAMGISMWKSSPPVNQFLLNPEYLPTIRLKFLGADSTAAQEILIGVCTAFSSSLEGLQSLSIRLLEGMSQQIWLTSFGLLPQLEAISVVGSSAETLIKAMVEHPILEDEIKQMMTAIGTRPQRRRDTFTSPAYFPTLHTLELNAMTFHEDIDYVFKNVIEQLMDFCMMRYESNAEIQTLRLNDCNLLTDAKVDLLKEIVVEVLWDRVEQGYADEEEDEEDEDEDEYWDELL